MIKEVISEPIAHSVGWFQLLCKCTVQKAEETCYPQPAEDSRWDEVTRMSDDKKHIELK